MKPTDSQSAPPTPATDAAWFDPSVASGSSVTPILHKPKWPIILAIIVILLGILLTVVAISGQVDKTISCIKPANYKNLVSILAPVSDDEVDIAVLYPQEVFFTYPIYFLPGTATINSDRSAEATDFLRSLGTYYKDNNSQAPISLTIETNRLADDYPTLAAERQTSVERMLLDTGVAADVIDVKEPLLVELSEESSLDDDVIDGMPVTVSITPATAFCAS